MAVPKRRVSKARRDKRRSNVWKMSAPQLEKCSNCGELKRTHRLCPECGYYNGKQVVVKEEA
ncbi:MAG: 50S ribosomal protein L32 [Clostridia bacterium]|jgi:large subunit ribosomal protein L32|nr:50S ribosomal protein L32 [Clostridia bacterium]